MSKKPVIYLVASELGADKKGSSLGPESVRLAGADSNNSFFKTHKIKELKSDNALLFEDIKLQKCKRLEQINKLCEEVKCTISEGQSRDEFPIIISGDHSIANGVVAGIRQQKQDSNIGIIWIDAHADIHSPYTTPSGNVHGMTVAAILGLDNLDHASNSLTLEEKNAWTNCKSLQSPNTNIIPEHVVFISARSIEQEERNMMEKNRMINIGVEDLRKNGIKKSMENLWKQLSSCTDIYVSFDVDCLDPSISKGTGTIADNGLFVNEVKDIVDHIMQDKRVCCFEITEINPLLDSDNKMGRIGFDILEQVTRFI